MLPAETRRRAAQQGIPPVALSGPETSAVSRVVAVRHVLMTADAVGGVWRYTVDLARALAPRGVRTTVAVMGPSPSVEQRSEARRAGLTMLTRPYRLEWMDDPWKDVEEAGKWLLSLERALCPDIIHINGYAHAALPWSAPVVLVAHSCVRTWWRAVKGEEAPPGFVRYGELVSAGLRAAAVVIAPSAAMLSALEREYRVGVRGRVIPNGRMICRAGSDPPCAAKQPLVLAAGRTWDEGKNIGALCAVADQLPWPVYVAGDTRAPDGITCDLESVHTLGRLTAEELARWYDRAAIYALPARYEPFGLSVLEAASAGCALVLGDIPSLKENWADAAVFVPPENHAALAAALRALIDEPSRRHDLARRAFDRAADFPIERTADGYLSAYQDVM